MKRSHSPVPALLLIPLLVAGFTFTACGGGGGADETVDVAPAPPLPPGGGDAAVLSIEPTVLQANANTRVTLRGTGLEGVVELRFLDVDGALLGSAMPAAVSDGGTRLRADAPVLPQVEGVLAARVQVRNGDGYFDPNLLLDEGGIDPVLRGFAAQRAQELDPLVVDDLRNFLFGLPGAGGLDLVALNMQRGRDHALPDYNSCRAAFGLGRMESSVDVTSNVEWAGALEAAFSDLDDADVWVVALAEDKVPGAMVGPLLHAVLRDQFLRMRNGDRFWYQNVFAAGALAELEETRLADVIHRNSGIAAELSGQVFLTGDGALPVPRNAPPPRRGRNATTLETLLQDRLFR